jgi:hypothetical protein
VRDLPPGRRGPALDGRLLGECHLSVEATTGHSQVEEALEPLGHHPDVALRVAHFAAIHRLLAVTRYLARRSQHRCPWCVRAGDVRSFTLPFEMSTIQCPSTPIAAPSPRPLSTGSVASSRGTVRTSV